MTAPPSTLRSIQAARAIAALLVVMHHISLRFEQRVVGTHFLGIFDRIGFAGVDLFFVISGLIMVVTCQRHFGRWTEAFPFLWRRVTRIYPLYWIFTIVQLTAILLIPTATARVITAENIMASFLLLPQSVYPILAPGWTLVYEMYFYLVFTLLFFIPRRFALHFLSYWGLLTLCLYATQTGAALSNPTGVSNTTDLLRLPIYGSPMTLEFLAGCAIGMLSTRRVNRFASLSLLVGTIWFIGGWVVVESLTNASAEYGMTRVLVFGISSTLILYGLVTRERNSAEHKNDHLLVNRLLITIGDASYSLYLSHLLVINVFAVIWTRFAMQGWMIQALFEIVLLLTCVCVAIISYRQIELPMLVWMRRDKHPMMHPSRGNF